MPDEVVTKEQAWHEFWSIAGPELYRVAQLRAAAAQTGSITTRSAELAIAGDRRRQALEREFGPERAEQYAQLEDRDTLWR